MTPVFCRGWRARIREASKPHRRGFTLTIRPKGFTEDDVMRAGDGPLSVVGEAAFQLRTSYHELKMAASRMHMLDALSGWEQEFEIAVRSNDVALAMAVLARIEKLAEMVRAEVR